MNLEEIFDFTNWREHPTKKRYFVFFFTSLEQGDHFEILLTENQIWFEKFKDEDQPNRPIWFAIGKNDMEQVKYLNNLTLGKYRKPFMPNRIFRWFVIVFAILVLGLAITGAIINNH